MDVSASDLRHSVTRAAGALLAARNATGFWEGRLASSPLATAVALAALADEGLADARRSQAVEYLARAQNSDGGWGDTEIGKSNLAATLLVLCSDAMLCHAAIPGALLGEEQVKRGEAFSEKLGGLREGLRRVYGGDLTFQVPIRMTAACAGLLPWNEVDALPFELALAPRSVMGTLRIPVVSYALPALVCVGLARHRRAPSVFPPQRWLRERIAGRALELIAKMQPQSGGYLEAVPITAFCLLALKAADCRDHPVARGAARFLKNTQRADGAWPVEVNLSVWNTTRAIEALHAAGMLETALNGAERAATRDWLLGQQATQRSVYSDARPGGWGWNHLSGSVPDADDTAGAILALRRLGLTDEHPALAAGQEWLKALQNANGGWPTFCRGWEKLPFDRSAPDLTAHALRAFGALPPSHAYGPAAARGWNYLRDTQRADGSFAPLWFGCEQAADESNTTYGTAHVLLACAQNAVLAQPVRGRALAFLGGIQNSDGGFGGCAGALSTAEETGLALRALTAHGATLREEPCARAARWLLERQRPDGSWNPAPIGFYFAVLWYYEELYPLCYTLGGLGQLAQSGVERTGAVVPGAAIHA